MYSNSIFSKKIKPFPFIFSVVMHITIVIVMTVHVTQVLMKKRRTRKATQTQWAKILRVSIMQTSHSIAI